MTTFISCFFLYSGNILCMIQLCTQVVGDVLIPLLVCQATDIAAKALEFIAEQCKIVSAYMCIYVSVLVRMYRYLIIYLCMQGFLTSSI